MQTFDSALVMDANGNHMGKKFTHGPAFVNDGAGGFKTYDSTGAFFVGELERLDQKLHEPLTSVTFGRDIDLREDVTIADEISSYTLSNFGSAGGLGTGQGIGNGKAWMGKNSTQITGVSVDIAKIPHPLRPWADELKYDILELESSAKVGRPIDQQKFQGLKTKHQMDSDEQAYYGDTSMGDTGLVNSVQVTNVSNVAPGAMGFTAWTTKTPAEILADVNTALMSVWAASAWSVVPSRILLPPAQFGYIATQLISQAGSQSILKYLGENNLMTTTGRGKIDIFPVKWAIGAGIGGTIGVPSVDRMIVYTKDENYVRWPMTLLNKTPIQYDGMYHKTTYYCRLGVVEVVYPETIGYFDQI